MKTNRAGQQDMLRSLNFWAGAWHGLLSISLAISVLAIGSPFTLRLIKDYQLIDLDLLPAAARTSVCTDATTGTTTDYTDVFQYVRCLATSNISIPIDYVHQPFGSIKIWILLLAFEIVTSFSHFRLFYRDEYYHDLLEIKLNPARWREYSVTNTLMLVSILSLSGISELYLVLHIALCAIFMNYCGGLVYELLSAIQRESEISPMISKLIREAKLVILLLSWAAFALSLIYLFDMFNATTGSYYALQTGFLWKQLFQIIFILNVGITICYSAFPVLHLVQTSGIASYYSIEKAYIVASLLAKSFLTIVVMAATIQRS